MHTYSLIAQSVERRTVNPQVPGSSPGRGAKFKKPADQLAFFIFILSIKSLLFIKKSFLFKNLVWLTFTSTVSVL